MNTKIEGIVTFIKYLRVRNLKLKEKKDKK